MADRLSMQGLERAKRTLVRYFQRNRFWAMDTEAIEHAFDEMMRSPYGHSWYNLGSADLRNGPLGHIVDRVDLYVTHFTSSIVLLEFTVHLAGDARGDIAAVAMQDMAPPTEVTKLAWGRRGPMGRVHVSSQTSAKRQLINEKLDEIQRRLVADLRPLAMELAGSGQLAPRLEIYRCKHFSDQIGDRKVPFNEFWDSVGFTRSDFEYSMTDDGFWTASLTLDKDMTQLRLLVNDGWPLQAGFGNDYDLQIMHYSQYFGLAVLPFMVAHGLIASFEKYLARVRSYASSVMTGRVRAVRAFELQYQQIQAHRRIVHLSEIEDRQVAFAKTESHGVVGAFSPAKRYPNLQQVSAFDAVIESAKRRASAADELYNSVRSELGAVLEVLNAKRTYTAQMSVTVLTWVTAMLTALSLAVAAYQVFGVHVK